MFPDLFSIGPLTIHTYGLFVAIGFTIALLVTIKLGKAEGINPQQIMDIGFVIIIWAIIGSRLMYVFVDFPHFKNRPLDIFKIWKGGLVFSGGLLAVAPAMIWYFRRHHLSFWKMADLWAPAVAIGQGIGRMGCFMAGCCYGKPTDMKWGVVFTHPNSLAPLNVPLHPTQLYACFSGLIIFLVLLVLHARKKFQGQVFLWLLILHSTGRLLVERFRGDYRGLVPGSGMSITQLVSLLLLISSVIMLFILKSKNDKEKDSLLNH